MPEIGQFHTLSVTQITEAGFILDTEEPGGVLLPTKHAPENLQVGDSVEVFLYLDTDDKPVTTTEKPKACVGEFAYLKVAANTVVGAFLDWGLEKDVLVPFAEQHRPMQEGHSYLVYLYLDKIQGRITATSKIDKVLDDYKPHTFKAGQPVNLIIANSTDLGYKAIINHSHWGVLYKDEVFQKLSFGQSIKGYIKHARPDGKIDLTLQAGQETRDKNAELIKEFLNRHEGFAPFHDKSDPQLIVKVLGMSKGAFKKAIGNLYRQRIISIEDDGIRLLQETAPAPTKKEPVKEKATQQPEANNSSGTDQRIVVLNQEPVELYKILKFEGLVGSGGEARKCIADGMVLLNGVVETQKRKKIVSGDLIEFGDEKLSIQLGSMEQQHDQ